MQWIKAFFSTLKKYVRKIVIGLILSLSFIFILVILVEGLSQRMILIELQEIPESSIWRGWIQDSKVKNANFCYWSGTRYEEYLMVNVNRDDYLTVKRNLTANLKLTEQVTLPEKFNAKTVSQITDWWDFEKLGQYMIYSPQDNADNPDRIIFNNLTNTIYFFSVRDNDYLKSKK